MGAAVSLCDMLKLILISLEALPDLCDFDSTACFEPLLLKALESTLLLLENAPSSTLPLLLLLYAGVERASSGIDMFVCLLDLVLSALPLFPVAVGDVVAEESGIDADVSG